MIHRYSSTEEPGGCQVPPSKFVTPLMYQLHRAVLPALQNYTSQTVQYCFWKKVFLHSCKTSVPLLFVPHGKAGLASSLLTVAHWIFLFHLIWEFSHFSEKFIFGTYTYFFSKGCFGAKRCPALKTWLWEALKGAKKNYLFSHLLTTKHFFLRSWYFPTKSASKCFFNKSKIWVLVNTPFCLTL